MKDIAKKVSRTRLAALGLAVIIVLSLTACGGEEENKDGGNSAASPLSGMVYVPEELSWSSELASLYGGCASGDWIFLSGACQTERGETHTIFRLPLAGGEAEALPDYQPLELSGEKWGVFFIHDVRPGEDGTIWVHESYMLVDINPVDPVHALRQLDAEGKELYCFSSQGRSKDLGGGTIQSIAADGGGDVAVLTDKGVVLFSREGEFLITLDLEGGEYPSLVRLGDGRVGVSDGYRDVSGNYVCRLRTVDKSSRGWGESYTLPGAAYSVRVYDGGGDVLFYNKSGDALYAMQAGAEEPEQVVDWLRAGMAGERVRFFSFLPDGRLVTMNRGYSTDSYTLSVLTPTDPDTLPEKTVLTYATMNMVSSERAAVLAFNRASQEYYIEVTDYNPEMDSAGYAAGLSRLTTEIAAGKVPDIINMDALGGGQWGAAGLFEDLWPYIERDPALGREALMERVFQAYEEDGKLYGISDRFRIQTLAGAKEVVGSGLSWTPEEFWAALERMPEGAVPLGLNGTKSGMLRQMTARSADRFLDWSAGTCDFESQGFKDILSFCAQFPDEAPAESAAAVEDLLLNQGQMLYEWVFGSLQTMQEMKYLLGGEVTFVGYPNEEGKVGSAFVLDNRLAISSASEHKDGAWSFLRTLLLPSENLTKDHCDYFPVNKADFEKMAELAMTPELDKTGREVSRLSKHLGTMDVSMSYFATTQAEYDQFLELYHAIDSAYRYDDSIMAIVTEQAGPYFAGDKSLDETASLIQRRAALYMGEQQ